MVAQSKTPTFPSNIEAGAARNASSQLRALQEPGDQTLELRVGDETVVALPQVVLQHILQMLDVIAHGNAVTIMPLHAELTTQEAATLLNVSRPFLVKLLDSGKIPFHKVGTHRRVFAKHVLDYKDARRKRSGKALDDLAADAQELELY